MDNDFCGVARCANAMEEIHTAIVIFRKDGKFSYANKMARKILQDRYEPIRSAENSLRAFMEFLYDYANEDELVQQNISPFGASRSVTDFHDEIILDNGEQYFVRFNQDDVHGVIVELNDISDVLEQTNHMQLLYDENRILLEAIQTSHKGILVADLGSDGQCIIFCNDQLHELAGTAKEDLVGEGVVQFFEYFSPEHISTLKSIITNHGQGELWKLFHDGGSNPIWLEIRIVTSTDDESGRTYLTCYFSDQTQMKSQQDKMQQTQKLEAIGQLAGGVAHDFNNVLSIVDGFVRLSESALKRGEDITDNLLKIRNAVSRGTGITRQLLLFGKHRVSEKKVFDVCHLIRDAEAFFAPLLGAGINLMIQTAHKPLWVEGTQDAYTQILMNLILNARDAMKGKGNIIISASEGGVQGGKNRLILKVSDTGCGIPPDMQSKIFDPFFTTKEAGKGTGLGLTQVYGLTRQMQGQVNIESEVGVGATFMFHFPLANPPVETERKKVDDTVPEILHGKTILIAEDEPDLREIVASTVGEWGMNVLKASDGIEALEVQDSYDGVIDILLTDMVMPRMGGAQMARLFKDVRPETQIMYASGYPERGDIEGVETPEGAVFMPKPVLGEDLQEQIVNILSGNKETSQRAVWQG